MCHRIALVCLILAVQVTVTPASAEVASRIGQQVDEFRLMTHLGNEVSLSEIEANHVVLVFLGTECPLVKLYAHRLSQLDEEFSARGVTFLGINSNTQDSLTEISDYANYHKISFPILKDLSNKVADHVGAERTPEVFVLDAERKIRYHGRIDDQYLVGLARDKADREDLRIALQELTTGESVSVPETEAVGCHIGRVKKLIPSGEITFTEHIAPILNARCVECHRDGQIAPFSLSSYEDLIGWEDTIVEVIEDRRMPPWFADPTHGEFSNDARLTDEERETIFAWIENGMPEGDPDLLPAAPKFAKGWRIPEPHQIVHMNENGFKVQAEGIVDYQYFQVDPGWTEDKYIDAVEARPGNTSVVHHIIVYVLPPKWSAQEGLQLRSLLVGYAPGSRPTRLQEGTAVYVPAGSKLLFEMHYTPNGIEQVDRSYAGFRFVDKDSVRKRASVEVAINTRFEIPPRHSNFPVTAEYEFDEDTVLLEMTPHMHLRGKSFRYEAEFPDGRREVLLDVPRYDFNWQIDYELKSPRVMPKGTKLICTAHFDNSAENFANPDPEQTVRWGEQSSEEMMIGWFGVITPFEPK